MKKPVYDEDADIDLPDPVDEDVGSGEDVDDQTDLDEDECAAVAAVIGFDPRTVEKADDET